ncbi:LrgB family protein [Cohnella candidum]|uniref:LrgB family protein n=1 Tax=Cohnella candidum TaxID=2674991 RepID=A0A3G3K5P0_9BACL|nr:LrgB family protein [Cohnella candidum]AYQ75774.1 LrgB family protein [Cohnella candidum]
MLPAICFLITLAIYYGVKKLYRVHPKPYLTPLLITPVIVVAVLLLSRTPYPTYRSGAHWISDMIGPATVALAVPIYKNLHVFKKHAFVIVTSVLFGSTVAILTSAGLAKVLHLSNQLIESIAPRSATTPIAMSISRMTGGIPTVTAILVLATGLLGMMFGPAVIRACRIRNEVARGVLFGTGAHTAGTSKAFEFGAVAGSISSIAMILTAFFTVFSMPWVLRWFL